MYSVMFCLSVSHWKNLVCSIISAYPNNELEKNILYSTAIKSWKDKTIRNQSFGSFKLCYVFSLFLLCVLFIQLIYELWKMIVGHECCDLNSSFNKQQYRSLYLFYIFHIFDLVSVLFRVKFLYFQEYFEWILVCFIVWRINSLRSVFFAANKRST